MHALLDVFSIVQNVVGRSTKHTLCDTVNVPDEALDRSAKALSLNLLHIDLVRLIVPELGGHCLATGLTSKCLRTACKVPLRGEIIYFCP
jgi:hypothetical protein